MFEISKCAQCGKQVTPENRSQFTEKNGSLLCSDCVGTEERGGMDMLEMFDKLHNTSFIQNRGDRRYTKAADLKEMIDVFEAINTGGRRRMWVWIIACLVIAGGSIAGAMLFTESGISDTDPDSHTEGISDSGQTDSQSPDTNNSNDNGDTSNDTEPDDQKPDKGAELLAEIKAEYAKSSNAFAARSAVRNVMAEYPRLGFKAFLRELEQDIADSAREELGRIEPEVLKTAGNANFEKALSVLGVFKKKYSDSQWYSGEGGGTRIAALEKKIAEKREAYISRLIAMVERFEQNKEYVKAYNTYDTILSICSTGQKPVFEKKRDELAARANAHFGEQGLKGYLKWQRYVEFRKEYLMYVKMRDFISLKKAAQEYLESSEYRLINTEIQEDLKDLSCVQDVIHQATEYFSKYIGKNYTLHTEDGKIDCIIKQVRNGNITIFTANVDISIPISELHVEDFFKSTETGIKNASFHLGMGILYLAAGEVEKAKNQFSRAEGAGADITRYSRHIKAYLQGKKEKEASLKYKNIQKLARFRKWDALIREIDRFKKKYSNTLFYSRRIRELRDLGEAAGARRENHLTLSRGFLPDPSYTGCMDTTLHGETSHSRRRNYGCNEYLYASGDRESNVLVFYDLGMIPPQAEIFSAVLSLYCHTVKDQAGDVLVRLYRVTERWEEGTEKQAKSAEGATWFEPVYTDGTRTKKGNWKVYGGTADTKSDYGYGPNGIISEYPLGHSQFLTFDVTGVVKEWVAGSRHNYGFMIRVEPDIRGASNCACFCSSEYSGDFSKHPQLSIHFRSRADEDISDMKLKAFDGYPGLKETFVFSGRDADDIISTVLIRESAPGKAERRSLWRGRIGNISSTRNRVLVSFTRVLSKIPPGAHIRHAELSLFVTESVSEKKDGGILDVWPVSTGWDSGSVNWKECSDNRQWSIPGCSGRKDRGLRKAASVRVPRGKDFRLEVDLTRIFNDIVSGEVSCNGFLLCMSNEYGTGMSFVPENSRTFAERPEIAVTYFQSELFDFAPLFTKARRNEWKYASLEKCRFSGGSTVNLIPGGSLITSKTGFRNFIITGEIRRYKGDGPAVIGISHGRKRVYNAVCGERCGIVFRRAGTDISKKLWISDKHVDFSEWTPVSIAVKGDTMYFRAGALYSGPVKGISLSSDCTISITAEDCFAGFRNLVAGRQRR